MIKSYAEPGECDLFFTGRQDAAFWFELSEDFKKTVLESATRLLDDSFEWKGDPASKDQPLRWPRKNVRDLDGFSVDPDSIPTGIRIAAMEQALYMADPAGKNMDSFSGKGIKSASLNGMSISLDTNAEKEMISRRAITSVRGLGTLRNSSGSPARCGTLFRG